MNTTLAVGVAGAALATAAVGGVAYAADSGTAPASAAVTTAATSTTAPSTTAPATGAKHKRRPLAARALHGSFTVQRKGATAVVDVQRGQVTRSDATSVTVRSTDGFEATYALNATSHIRKDKKPATATALTDGAKVGVVADDDSGHPTVRLIRVAG